MKIRPVGAKSFHADGRTDMKKLIVAFHTFANAPEDSNRLNPKAITTGNRHSNRST